MTARERLTEIRKEKGLSQAKLSKTLGFSGAAINQMENGRLEVGSRLAEALHHQFGVNPDWLLRGEGERYTPQQPFKAGRKDIVVGPPDYSRPAHGDFRVGQDEYVLVSRFDISLSAGSGLVPAREEEQDAIAFSTRFMSGLGVNADLCVLVRARGDSMAPNIPDGALILLHRGEFRVDSEGVYAFGRDEDLFVKRLIPLQKREDGAPDAVMIVSDGLSGQTETLQGAELLGLRIIGRVRAVITTY